MQGGCGVVVVGGEVVGVGAGTGAGVGAPAEAADPDDAGVALVPPPPPPTGACEAAAPRAGALAGVAAGSGGASVTDAAGTAFTTDPCDGPLARSGLYAVNRVGAPAAIGIARDVARDEFVGRHE